MITENCRPHTTDSARRFLPPAPFGVHVPVMAMSVPGSHPYCMGARGLFPPAPPPGVGIAIPVVVSGHPHMLTARPGGTMLANADGGPQPDYDLRMSGYPDDKTKQRGKKQFSHNISSCGYTSRRMAVYPELTPLNKQKELKI